MPPGEPDEPELLLGGDELGTGMLGGLGWVMTVIRLRKLVDRGARSPGADPRTTANMTPGGG
jgi:hypothetical protein